MNKRPISLKKATAEEIAEYQKQKPVYPLGYWVNMYDEHGEKFRVAVEDLRCWGKPDPQWEIIMPQGYIAEDCHTLLCYDLADVRSRSTIWLDKCDCSECREFWKGENNG